MKQTTHTITLLLIIAGLLGCQTDQTSYDATGYFETTETTISAQANGELIDFDIVEGQTLHKGERIGQIDSTQTYLQLEQTKAQMEALLSQKPNIAKQIAVLQTEIETAHKELKRLQNLQKEEAATQKQLDDANAHIDMLSKELERQKNTLSQATTTIIKQSNPLHIQIKQITNQLEKHRIINPTEGLVLVKYAQPNELVSIGRPLYKIGDLQTLICRAYITYDQLSHIKLNDTVQVAVQTDEQNSKTYQGTIQWISDKAEFTPKTIQTKNERANQTYAIKINVPNSDGYLKIGMYGEITF